MRLLRSLLKNLILLTVLYTTISMAPKATDLYIRAYVGSQTFKITNLERQGSGSGSAMRLPNGRVVIITNQHVCEGVRDISASKRLILLQGNKVYKTRIIKVFAKHDLCAMEAPEGFHGLYLGSEARVGQEIWAVGHPRGLPLTVSSGHTIETMPISVAYAEVPDASLCPKGSTAERGFMTFYCVKTRDAVYTNMIILPGNSGSPVVDRFGMVVGVVFAGDNTSNWGSYVPFSALQAFVDQLSK